jgi:molybdate transport system permease protein
MHNNMDWISFWITCKLALVTTGILLIIGIVLSLWLTSSKKWYKLIISELINLPLVLPSTVLGYYLLILFSPTSLLGSLWLKMTGSTLTFSFSGLVIASIIYSLPFAVKPIHDAFFAVQKQAMGMASLFGASYLDRLLTVLLPLSMRGVLTSMIVVFAHTIGEFGVVLMVGGAIEGETKVISIAIYEQVAQLNYNQTNHMATLMILFAVLILCLVYWLNRKKNDDCY